MSKTVNVSDSVTLYPSSFDSANSSYASVVSNYPIENGYTDSSSGSAARFNISPITESRPASQSVLFFA